LDFNDTIGFVVLIVALAALFIAAHAVTVQEMMNWPSVGTIAGPF
jgi:hypothetical protein